MNTKKGEGFFWEERRGNFFVQIDSLRDCSKSSICIKFQWHKFWKILVIGIGKLELNVGWEKQEVLPF